MDWIEKITVSALPLEGGIVLGFFIAVSLTSLFEREQRAACMSLVAGSLLSLPFLLPVMAGFRLPGWIALTLGSLPAVSLLVLFLPFRGKATWQQHNPAGRFDERDTMFSRSSLVPGSERYREYYARRPGNKVADNQFRRKPGLLKAGTRYYDPILFAAAASIFDRVVDELHPRVEGAPAPKRAGAGPQAGEASEQLTRMLLGMAVEWGAHSAGITELRDYHVYSVGGRGERYGMEFGVEHKYALALTVEMDYDMMRTAPAAPTMLESARQYLQSGLMAVLLAEFIRSLGYPARAHIDGNYKVICPLVARDAGLGEIGRMGLLMTPRIGPRCRIAVVTTDLPLVPGRSAVNQRNAALTDFCRRCEKCAAACPARSIPFGAEKEINGVKRWRIDSESCYTYWCQAGTDCGRCMIVCPFSHPDNWFHKLVRYGIRNNRLFRRLALPLDDLFYGKKPKPRVKV